MEEVDQKKSNMELFYEARGSIYKTLALNQYFLVGSSVFVATLGVILATPLVQHVAVDFKTLIRSRHEGGRLEGRKLLEKSM